MTTNKHDRNGIISGELFTVCKEVGTRTVIGKLRPNSKMENRMVSVLNGMRTGTNGTDPNIKMVSFTVGL